MLELFDFKEFFLYVVIAFFLFLECFDSNYDLDYLINDFKFFDGAYYLIDIFHEFVF
jgi:hypothetical protein